MKRSRMHGFMHHLSVLLLWAAVTYISLINVNVICAQETSPPKAEPTIVLTPDERAWLVQNHTIRVRVTDQPPYFYNKDGEPAGIAVDFLNTVSKRTGIKFHFVIPSPPFSEDLRGLIQHTGPDLFGTLTPTPEREKKILFTEPYVSSPKFIFTRDDAEFVSSMKNLSGKTVAVIKDYLVHKELAKNYPHIDLVFSKNNKDALRAVSSSKAFAFIGGLLSTPFMINEYGFRNLKAAAPSTLQDATVAMAVRSDLPELRDIMNKVFDAMSESEKAAIINKWSSVRVDYGIRPADVLKWILMVSGAASFLILLFVFWNRSLAKQVKERTADLESSVLRLSAEIAERNQAEEELRISRDYLKRLTDSMPDAVFSVTMPDRIIDWANDTFKVLGYDPEECIGKTTEFLYPSRKAYVSFGNELARAVAEGEDVLHIEQNLRKKSGEVFPADITVSLFRTDVSVVSATAIVRNIAERKKAEEALQHSEEKLRLLVEQSPLSIQIFNPDGRIIQVNDAWNELWGFSEEMLPEVLEKYNILEDEEARKLGVMPFIEKAFKGGSVVLPVVAYDASATVDKLSVGGAGGKSCWIQLRLYPIKNEKGEVVNVVGIEEDITSRKQAEQEILAYQERLKALAFQLTLAEEKERRAIAADLHDHVGHSLALARMQLDGIVETTSNLERSILVKDISHILLKALQDTRNLISELSSPSMNELGLSAAISEWLEEQIADRQGLETEFIDNVRDEHRKVLDKNIRAILFRNVRELLVNVIKHARANKVRVHLTEETNGLKIVVEDDGIGFAPGAESIKLKQAGGFGLFSIQERMTDLDGSLNIQSEPGKGCRVILTVPVDAGKG